MCGFMGLQAESYGLGIVGLPRVASCPVGTAPVCVRGCFLAKQPPGPGCTS
jgi:hypothetical protein